MNSFLVSLFEHKAWANRNIFNVVRAVPAGKRNSDYVFATMVLGHASLVDRVFRARLLGEEHDFKAVIPSAIPDPDELWETVKATDAWYSDYVRSVSADELAETIGFVFVSDGEEGRMTKEEILAHVLTHSASHRAQTVGLLAKIEIGGHAEMFTTYVSRGRGKSL